MGEIEMYEMFTDGFEVGLLKWFIVVMALCDILLCAMVAYYGKRLHTWDLRGNTRYALAERHVRLTNAVMVVTLITVFAIEICVRLSPDRYEIPLLLLMVHLLCAFFFAFFFITARFFRNGKKYPEMHRIIVRMSLISGALAGITGAYPLYTL